MWNDFSLEIIIALFGFGINVSVFHTALEKPAQAYIAAFRILG